MTICIDGEILKNLYSPRLQVVDGTDQNKDINIGYYPGNLSLTVADYNYLKSQDVFLLIFRVPVDGGEYQTYEIEAGKDWLDLNYIILNIYNTDNRKYKNKLSPLPGKKYTFELDYPGGQMLRVRKK